MSTTKYYARIAITLPQRDLALADRLARSQDRSRSWIVAEAIRQYAAASAAASAAPRNQPGLGASRLAQLTHDLRLTPEQRVLAAEATLRQTGAPARPRRHHVLAFDRYDDFLDWKRSRDAGG